MMRKTYLAAAMTLAAMFSATGALAACSTPTAIGGTDTVIQFANKSAAASQGAMGTKSTLNPTLPGTLYYDHLSKGLKLCDGANWVDIQQGGSGAGAAGGTFPVYSVWTKTINEENLDQLNAKTVTFTAPIDPAGTYKIDLSLTTGRHDSYCKLYLQKAGGSTLLAEVDPHTSIDDDYVTTTLYGKNNDSYAYDTSSRPYEVSSRNSGFGLGLSGVGNLTWNDTFRLVIGDAAKNNSNGNIYPGSCTGTLKILRTQ
jgi:hypothetical protein